MLMPNDKQSSLKNRYAWLLWPLIVIIVVAPRVLGLDVFYARDELIIWRLSDEFTRAVWNGNPAGTIMVAKYFPGVPMYWAQTLFLTVKYTFPSFFQSTMVPIAMLFQEHGLDLLAERRLVAGLLISIQIIVSVWMVYRLFGWRVALLSAIFLGLDPFSLSETRVFRLEMLSSLFVCLSLLAHFLYLRHRRPWFMLLSGIMVGLGVSSKISAGLVVPYIWLVLLLDFLFETNRTWLEKFKQMIINGLIWAAGAIVTFWVIWPAMWVKPFEAMQGVYAKGFSSMAESSAWHGVVFFWGQIFEQDPGPLFYLVVFAFRTTPLTWIGVAGALLLLSTIVWQRVKNRSYASPQHSLTSPLQDANRPPLWKFPWPGIAIILILAQVTLITIGLMVTLSKVDRYLLIVFPSLNILSAIGFVAIIRWIIRWIPKLSSVAQGWLSVGFIVAILGIQLGVTLPAYPYFFTYWNPWIGGGRAAMETLPVGAGEGIDLAVNYLNSQPGAAEATLICGASRPWCERLFNGETVRYAPSYSNGTWIEADYVSFYISHLQRQNYPPEIVDFFMPQTPLYQVDLQGATYVWVYNVPEVTHFAGPSNDLPGLGRLLGYDLSPPVETEVEPGQTIEATIWWANWGGGVDNLVLRLVDETGYEWARAGAIPLPEYALVPPEQYAIVAGTATLTVPPGAPPGLYYLRMGILEPDEERLLGEFAMPAKADRLVVTPGQTFTDPALFAIPHPIDQSLAPEITLLGYLPPDQVLTADTPTWLTLYWQATAPPADYRVVLRLLNSDNQEVIRWQGQPGHGRYPTQMWQPGEIVRDVWPLQVESETPIGQYNLEISLLDYDDPEIQNPVAKIQNIEVWPQPISYDVPDMQAELQVDFGDRLTLLGYDLYFDVEGAGTGSLSPYLYWQSRLDFQERFDVVLMLRNAETDQVIEEWQVPLGINEAKAFWKAGEVINPIYQLETRAMLEGRYHLDIALQEQAGSQTEPVKLDDGTETTFIRIENIQDKIVVRVN